MPRICTTCHSPIPIPDDAKFCPSCGARAELAAQPAAPVHPAAPEADAALTQFDAPQLIGGRFSVRGPARTNEVGTVFSATDTQQGNALVCVVVASTAALPSSALADRALREWKQLSKVPTPKIVRVIDQGKFDDGTVFVVSDVPAGVTLEELVTREGPLPIERIKEIVAQVGEALSEAQKVGVIHRDVAPRNIHVDGSHVSVGAFGLAEVVNDRVFGSPAFLSPEQAEGKPVDQRSNIYSLGAVIYYMLTGKTPFEGNTESLLAQHIAGTPPHPSAIRSSVPVELDRIVTKALEKSGGRRHLTLRQLITEVEAVSSGAAVVRSAELGTAATLGIAATPLARAAPRAPMPSATVLGMPSPVIHASPSRPTAAATTRMSAEPETFEATNGHASGKTVVTDVPTFDVESGKRTAHHDVPVFETGAASAPHPHHGDVPVFVPAPTSSVAARSIVNSRPKQEVAPMDEPTPVKPSPVVEKAVVEKAVVAAVVQPVIAAIASPVAAAVAAPPVVAAIVPSAAPVVLTQKKQDKPGAGFRETAWFKKGEIEEEIAKAEASAATADPLAPSGITGAHDIVDSGAVPVTSQDHNRLSLKTGATQMMQAVRLSGTGGAQALPGERMDESEMLSEMEGGSRGRIVAGAIAAAVLVGAILYYAVHNAEPEPTPAAAPTSQNAPVAPVPALPPPVYAPQHGKALDEARAAAAKADYPLTVDALLRASKDGSDLAQVEALAASTHATLVQASLDATHRHDSAGAQAARALAAKIHGLLPPPAARTSSSKHGHTPGIVATRKR